MPMFEIRKNCEYIAQIEAESEDEAVKTAEKADNSGEVDWDEAWSPITAEPIDDFDTTAAEA
jgi:hypothetical protein